MPELIIESTSVVCVGDFMPAVFHPSWLASKNLLAPKEAESAKIELVHPDATIFATDWLALNVRRDRLAATCVRGESVPLLKDLIIGVLQLFANSPLAALGLNKDLHFKMDSEQSWHELGHKLAPKPPWGGILEKPGLLSLQMQGVRNDSRSGTINVVVQPSVKVKFGAFVQINDHYNLTKDNKPGPASDAIEIIKELWASSHERSMSIASKIVKL